MKDYSVIDGICRDYTDKAKSCFDKGYKQGYADGKDEAYKNPVPTQDAYQKGLDDAWDAARKLVSPTRGGISAEAKVEICGKPDSDYILLELSASEAIAKIKEYEETQNDEIRVGDEVIHGYTKNKMVVIGIKDSCHGKAYTCLGKNGVGVQANTKFKPIKTGRHFSQIEEVLKQMQE